MRVSCQAPSPAPWPWGAGAGRGAAPCAAPGAPGEGAAFGGLRGEKINLLCLQITDCKSSGGEGIGWAVPPL